MNYATLAAFKRYKNVQQATEDTLLNELLDRASRFIEKRCGRRYDVRKETRSFDVPSGAMLILDDDLLQVDTLTNGDDTTLAATEYILQTPNRTPSWGIKILATSDYDWEEDGDGETEGVIDVDGLWGYHDRYADAWRSADSVQDADGIAADATSITVSDKTNFEAGQMIRLESEFCLISALGGGESETLVVERGYNGTTAAAHDKDTAIEIYQPMANIVMACIRLAAWRFSQKNADAFDQVYVFGMGAQITIPTAIPDDILALLPPPKVEAL